MGLSASQARYLFLSSRANDLESNLLKLSAESMRLTYLANDIADEKDYALNLQHLEFNDKRFFNYSDMMGENAVANGQLYFMTTNDGNNRVVLNTNYANAMKAAGIPEEGGQASQEGLINFMGALQGRPKGDYTWKEAVTGHRDSSGYAAIDNFNAVYGAKPAQGIDPSKSVDHYKEVTKTETMSFDQILNKMGNTGNFKGISNLDGRSTKGWQNIEDQSNCDCSYADLVKKTGDQSGRVCLINDKEKLSYDEIWSRARMGFRNLANTIANKIISATGMPELQQPMSNAISTMEQGINGNLGQHRHHSEDKAKRRGKSDANNGLIGVAVDKTGTDQVWVYCNTSELTRRLLTAASNYGKSGNDVNAVNTNCQGSQQKYNSAASVTKTTTTQEFDYTETHPYTNDKGYTYEDWMQEWNNFVNEQGYDANEAETYRTSGATPEITLEQEDAQALKMYEQIYIKSASQGWKEDNDLDKTENLTAKLQNLQYLVNSETIKESSMFATVNTNNEEVVKSYYEKQEREIQVQEKKVDAEKTATQTELTAVETEISSVKSIIDKNIERGFNLFG